jgi:Protein of unknown function (DUF3987)
LAEYEADKERAKIENKKWEDAIREAVAKGEPLPKKPKAAEHPKAPAVPFVVISDATPEKIGALLSEHLAGLLLHRDELAGWLGNFNRYANGKGGEREMWLEAYEGRGYRIDRVKSPAPIGVPFMTVGVLGSIQPDKLAPILKGPDDGFVSRFLWTWPEPVSGYHLYKADIDGSRHLAALRRIFHLKMMGDEEEHRGQYPVRVPLTDEAGDVFEAFMRRNKAKGLKSPPLMAASVGKAGGHVLRIAMVLALLGWSSVDPPPQQEGAILQGGLDPALIDAIYISNAVELVEEYFHPMAARVFGEAVCSGMEKDARNLACWIAAQPERTFKFRDAYRGAGLRDKVRREAAFQRLLEADLIRPYQANWIPEMGAKHPLGRPPKVFEKNPVM